MTLEPSSPRSPTPVASTDPPAQAGPAETPRHSVGSPMSRPRLTLCLLACALVVAACDDPTSAPYIVPPDLGPSFSLYDASTDGPDGFYFLPPLVSNPTFGGIADMDRSPRVDICEVANGECVQEVKTFSGNQILTEDEYYKVEWKAEDSNVTVIVDVPYRIHVSLGAVTLGTTEVVFEAGGNARRANTSQEVGVNRTVPIRFRIEAGTLASALQASECDVEGDDAVDDCDVVEGTTTQEITTTVRDPDDEDNRVAGFVRIPEQTGALAGEQILIVQKLLANPIAGASIPTGDQIPYFLQVQVFGSDGELVTDEFEPEAYLALCQPPDVSASLIPFLSIFRFSDGNTQILDTNRNTPECFDNANGNDLGAAPGSLLDRTRSSLHRVAGLFRAQPLQALHGGLHTTTPLFSEFGAVVDLDEAPFDYGTEFEWSSSAGSGVGPAPFYTPGDFSICSDLDIVNGTGGAQVWPLGGNATGQESDITLTKHFTSSSVGEVRVWVGIDNDVKVTLNGQDITATHETVSPGFGTNPSLDDSGFLRHEGCAVLDAVHFSGPAVVGVNELEVVARDRGTIGYVNVRVELLDNS
jgi:hypothetical protein